MGAGPARPSDLRLFNTANLPKLSVGASEALLSPKGDRQRADIVMSGYSTFGSGPCPIRETVNNIEGISRFANG